MPNALTALRLVAVPGILATWYSGIKQGMAKFRQVDISPYKMRYLELHGVSAALFGAAAATAVALSMTLLLRYLQHWLCLQQGLVRRFPRQTVESKDFFGGPP